MTRTIAFVSALLALGHSAASGYINYAMAGSVGLLAVGTNTLAPFWIHTAKQRSLKLLVFVLWLSCLTYSFTTAIAYVAAMRQSASSAQIALHENYKMELQTLRELEQKQRTKTNETLILAQRAKVATMRANGAVNAPEPHVTLFARLTGIEGDTIQLTLLVILSIVIEAGAAITLFASVGHIIAKPDPNAKRLPIYDWNGACKSCGIKKD